ncbi:MAG: hypothetical protein OEU50_11260 [Gammaproteobacteria bacterium]|nr:hypothetical protein [Gammaproteobacteria bacterium]
MKRLKTLAFVLAALVMTSAAGATDVKSVSIGDVEVLYDYRKNETGIAILTLIAQVAETNNSLRGLKNTDRRRLGKLGQLIYQCKLMQYKSDKNDSAGDAGQPFLISKNYSLFTGVELSLAADERVGIQAQALQAVDDESLFSPALGKGGTHKGMWETVAQGSAINLKQLNVNVFSESDLIETSESIDIVVRFPVFQLKKPVSQWSYNFMLKDFKQAIRHIDENCTSARLLELGKRKT